jgi:hypothetical protein
MRKDAMKMPNPRDAAVKILTETPGILVPSITGIGESVQAIEVEISESGRSVGRLVIVGAHFPQLSASVCDNISRNLRSHFQDADLYFTIIDKEGEAEVYAPAEQGRLDRFWVAAAVAVIKASWGWDEVNPMLITVSGEPVRVKLAVVDRSWTASMANAA